MSEVSISRFKPSLEGVEVCSSWDCVRTVITWLILKGETKCVPSGKILSVTRPNEVSTPTWPGGTYAMDAKTRMATSKITSPIPISRENEPGFTSITLDDGDEKLVMQDLLLTMRLVESQD